MKSKTIANTMRLMAEPDCHFKTAPKVWLRRGAEHIEQLEKQLAHERKMADRRYQTLLEKYCD